MSIGGSIVVISLFAQGARVRLGLEWVRRVHFSGVSRGVPGFHCKTMCINGLWLAFLASACIHGCLLKNGLYTRFF